MVVLVPVAVPVAVAVLVTVLAVVLVLAPVVPADVLVLDENLVNGVVGEVLAVLGACVAVAVLDRLAALQGCHTPGPRPAQATSVPNHRDGLTSDATDGR